jgi:hypothetical protein
MCMHSTSKTPDVIQLGAPLLAGARNCRQLSAVCRTLLHDDVHPVYTLASEQCGTRQKVHTAREQAAEVL